MVHPDERTLLGVVPISDVVEKPRDPLQFSIQFFFPILIPILNGRKCHGILYASNSSMHEAYTMADLDYLMLISIHAAAMMELI